MVCAACANQLQTICQYIFIHASIFFKYLKYFFWGCFSLGLALAFFTAGALGLVLGLVLGRLVSFQLGRWIA